MTPPDKSPITQEGNMSKYYDMDGNPMTLLDWAAALEKSGNQLRQDTVGDVSVSTVWLGLDHSFGGPKPLIFETMVFGGTNSEWQDRYSTKDAAVAGHDRVVEIIRSGGQLDA